MMYNEYVSTHIFKYSAIIMYTNLLLDFVLKFSWLQHVNNWIIIDGGSGRSLLAYIAG